MTEIFIKQIAGLRRCVHAVQPPVVIATFAIPNPLSLTLHSLPYSQRRHSNHLAKTFFTVGVSFVRM